MAVSRQKKEEVLQKLIDEFGKSQSIAFADYRGLSVTKMSELRSKLREGNAGMTVAKKTLIGLAADKSGLGEIDPSYMQGPVAATFSYQDALSGIKILFNFAKENEELKLLGGVIEGKVVGPDVMNEFAKLPGRDELLAKLIGSMNAPISGFVGISNNLVAGLVRVLNAYKDTLPEDGSAPTAEPAGAETESPEAKEEPAPSQADTPTPAETEAKTEEKAESKADAQAPDESSADEVA